MKADVFINELALIKNARLKELVTQFLNEKVPDYFFSVAASSSGKYHPKFALGEGGLVRHTKMVVAVLNELVRVQTVPNDVFDCLVAACILHDTFKHGTTDSGTTVSAHADIAAEEWAEFLGDDMQFSSNEIIYYCILKHMGQWGSYSSTNIKLHSAIDGYCAIVHLADYIASRKFFDTYPNR